MFDLAAAAFASLSAALSDYTERERGLLTRELQAGCYAWVGVMTSQHYGGELVLTPNAGLHHGDVEDALASILGFETGPTVLTNIGYLTERRAPKQWRVGVTTTDRVAAEIASAVRGVAEPFARRCLNLELLEQALREHALDDHRFMRQPVIAVLRGDADGAAAAFSDVRAKVDGELGDRSAAARERRTFVARFPEWAAAQHTA